MAGLEGFTSLTIDLDGDDAWADLGPDDFAGGMATHVAVLPNGTSGTDGTTLPTPPERTHDA